MKNVFLLALFAFTGAFAQEDVVKFTAKVQNRNSDTLTIGSRLFKRVMVSDKKGNFKESFPIAPGFYQLHDGSEVATVFLKNGFDLSMTLDAKMFDETLSFKGKGAKENNYLAKKFMDNERLETSMETLDDNAAITKLIDEAIQKSEEGLKDPDLDETFRRTMALQVKNEKQQLTMMAMKAQKLKELRGKPSPSFAYENFKGGITKLEDLRGKYVYVDVWATWCGPCRQQIPYLQQMEKDYHGKNIEFVSISIDEMKNHDKWKKFVEDKALGGVQLFADKDWSSDFVTAYGIRSIPRFLLIDPQGNIVEADAPRPSDPKLRQKLDRLLK